MEALEWYLLHIYGCFTPWILLWFKKNSRRRKRRRRKRNRRGERIGRRGRGPRRVGTRPWRKKDRRRGVVIVLVSVLVALVVVAGVVVMAVLMAVVVYQKKSLCFTLLLSQPIHLAVFTSSITFYLLSLQGCHIILKSNTWLSGWGDLFPSFLLSWLLIHKLKRNFLSRVRLFATPWTVQSMEFPRPEYWSGWPFPSPGDLPNPGIEPRSPTLQVDSLSTELSGKP